MNQPKHKIYIILNAMWVDFFDVFIIINESSENYVKMDLLQRFYYFRDTTAFCFLMSLYLCLVLKIYSYWRFAPFGFFYAFLFHNIFFFIKTNILWDFFFASYVLYQHNGFMYTNIYSIKLNSEAVIYWYHDHAFETKHLFIV